MQRYFIKYILWYTFSLSLKIYVNICIFYSDMTWKYFFMCTDYTYMFWSGFCRMGVVTICRKSVQRISFTGASAWPWNDSQPPTPPSAPKFCTSPQIAAVAAVTDFHLSDRFQFVFAAIYFIWLTCGLLTTTTTITTSLHFGIVFVIVVVGRVNVIFYRNLSPRPLYEPPICHPEFPISTYHPQAASPCGMDSYSLVFVIPLITQN